MEYNYSSMPQIYSGVARMPSEVSHVSEGMDDYRQTSDISAP